MKQVINVKFKELRNTSVRMCTLVQRTLGVKDVDARTCFNDDLGVVGLDWDSFLVEYNKEFGVALDGLVYSKYFDEETPSISDILLLPYTLARLLIFYSIGRGDLIKQKPPLTIGDLIVSVHVGQFVKREDIEIRFN